MTLSSVLVTDTNIFIDLENGKILADVFHLPYQFFTTDFAINEIVLPDWSRLQELGLKALVLEPEYVLELIRLQHIHHQLSVVDLAALLLAKASGASLVTGDRRLNELTLAQRVPVHGVFGY